MYLPAIPSGFIGKTAVFLPSLISAQAAMLPAPLACRARPMLSFRHCRAKITS
jgi:hypothetical protein